MTIANNLLSRAGRLPDRPAGGPNGAGCNGRSHTVVRLREVTRVVMQLSPTRPGSAAEQIAEILAAREQILSARDWPMQLTTQTVFLADPADQSVCAERLASSPWGRATVTQFVQQAPPPPARLAMEAWAVGGPGVIVQRLSAQATLVSYDGLRWLYANTSRPRLAGQSCYRATQELFEQTTAQLRSAGMGWEQVIRTWWYLGDITGYEGGVERYQELNRARAEAFAGVTFGGVNPSGYPASTGIGMSPGAGTALATLALQTDRKEVRLVPVENPRQIPAYDYARRYSQLSPKFSRAMALVTPDYITTWISGTASIVQSEVSHPDDAVAQTEQTLDNIRELIAAENFARHGIAGAGTTLRDLAKVRVYVKRAEDFAACQAVCARRLGNVPALFLQAEVCRPELLVEIEGVTFTRRLVAEAAG